MKRDEILRRMGMTLPINKRLRLIISSDVKNEADDHFAIVHSLLTPIFDVRGVVASHFESKAPGTRTTMEASYNELQTLMDAAGVDDVPMLRGCRSPLERESDAPESEGVDFIIREALLCDARPLYITVQGALTDVAAAINRRPDISDRIIVVWIGGMAYPKGGSEFNMMQDVAAARAVFRSKAQLWQIPVTAYCAMEVTMAELAHKVRRYGDVGRYLYREIEEYNLNSTESAELRKGENWCLGDSPAVGALLQCGWRGNYHIEKAPLIAEDMTYEPNPAGKRIRVYDFVDVRMILEDFFAKLALCYE